MERRVYNDFDAFSCDVTNFDGRILLNNPCRSEWGMSHIDLGGVHVQIGLVGSGNIVEGKSWDGFMLYLPLTGHCRKTINGEEIGKHSFLLFEPGSEHYLCSSHAHSWASIFVPTDVWTDLGHSPALRLGGETGTCQVMSPDRRLAVQGRALVREIETAAANCEDFEDTQAAAVAAAKAVNFVSLFTGKKQDSEPHPRGRPRIPRQEVIHRCIRLLEEREGEHVSTAELATRAEVSERTLETVFKEYFGEVPTRYLQLRQLHQIHEALRTARCEETTVTKVLVDHGEFELGRFAGRYSQLFGELPSRTLQRH
jgi:AraC-like DNA-binding protein